MREEPRQTVYFVDFRGGASDKRVLGQARWWFGGAPTAAVGWCKSTRGGRCSSGGSRRWCGRVALVSRAFLFLACARDWFRCVGFWCSRSSSSRGWWWVDRALMLVGTACRFALSLFGVRLVTRVVCPIRSGCGCCFGFRRVGSCFACGMCVVAPGISCGRSSRIHAHHTKSARSEPSECVLHTIFHRVCSWKLVDEIIFRVSEQTALNQTVVHQTFVVF